TSCVRPARRRRRRSPRDMHVHHARCAVGRGPGRRCSLGMMAPMTVPAHPREAKRTKIDSAGASDPGRVRSVNQDSYFVGEVGAWGPLAVVAEGMGGHPAGEIASRRAVDVLTDTLRPGRAHPPVALARAAQAANVEVYNYAVLHPE